MTIPKTHQCWLTILWITLLPTGAVQADRVAMAPFCQALSGQWQGNAARAGEAPKQVTVSGLCSSDSHQLFLSVSRSAKYPLSESWWFREQGDGVLLTYYDGVDADKQQYFSLYRQGEDFSLLGQGEVNKRPALIQLLFDAKKTGWQWRQNVQFLDDDSQDYLFFRGIDLLPVTDTRQK
jgi:hypothetical protein